MTNEFATDAEEEFQEDIDRTIQLLERDDLLAFQFDIVLEGDHQIAADAWLDGWEDLQGGTRAAAVALAAHTIVAYGDALPGVEVNEFLRDVVATIANNPWKVRPMPDRVVDIEIEGDGDE